MYAIVFAVVLITGLLLSLFKRLPPKKQRKLMFQGGMIGVVGILLFLLVTGRLNPLFALLVGVLPFARRLWGLLNIMRWVRQLLAGWVGGAKPSVGQTSSVRTRYLDMSLDHDSGVMDAKILQGDFVGRRLSEMSLAELDQLLSILKRDDPESEKLLLTWLARQRGQEREAEAPSEGPSSGSMSHAKAREILGVAAGANRDQIILAHRRLMQKFHPDRGGSGYLAREINHAKKVLLNASNGNS